MASAPAAIPRQPASMTLPMVAFLSGQFVSSVGSRINAVALPLLTIERYGIGLSIGLVTATRLVPRVILGPAAGALADRLPRRATLIATHLVSGGLIAVVPFTTALWHLYLLGALVGLVEALLRPARFAILPEVFPPALLYRVNAAEEVLDALSNILGPTLAIALIAAFTTSGAFWVDALSYRVGAACLLALRPLPARAAPAPAAAIEEVRGGTFRPIWRLLRADPILGLLLGVNAVYTLGIGVLLVLYAPLALRIGAGEWGFGAIVTATGAGALLGTVLAPRLGPRLTPRLLLAGLACLRPPPRRRRFRLAALAAARPLPAGARAGEPRLPRLRHRVAAPCFD